MSDAIGALGGIVGALGGAAGAPTVQDAAVAPEVSRPLEADFHQALQNEVSFVPEQVGGAAAMGQALNQKLEGLSSYLNQWGVEPAGQAQAAAADPANAAQLVAQIQATYTFAIETTLVSKGSTETTKIFNTLLKGQ